VTAFKTHRIEKIKQYAPTLRTGFLAKEIDGDLLSELIRIDADELCPKGSDVTKEKVTEWHRLGFNVRAWGIGDEEIMKQVYDAGADGMTVNFPDTLLRYIEAQKKEQKDPHE
ncbi:MAG: hypothetical protein IJX72_01265, partial [Clostridia bacterium]|nr:hypothetical protein [Clostridia bacterium]